MSKLRFLFALWAAKLSRPLLKITRHNGTNFPGELAIKLCPDFLKYIGKPKHIISVTGTNGKTTVSNMVCDIFDAMGKKVLDNRAGSNINSGIATSLIIGSTLFGKAKFDTAVFETDERSALRIYPWVRPEYILMTNLFRDSIMRNGHPEFIAGILTDYIPRESKLILNADDLISCSVAPENQRVYYGIRKLPTDLDHCENLINDMRICPRCAGKLSYDYLRYHHIGRAHCSECGFTSPEYDYYGDNITSSTVTIGDKKGAGEYTIVNDSIFNIYNMVAVAALFRQMGVEHRELVQYMSKAKVVESRYKQVQHGGVQIITQLAKEKNALAITRAFDYVRSQPGKKTMLLMMNCLNDEKHWSENTCWMYDCDFEMLNDDLVQQIVVSGPRARDYKLRLLFAGVAEEKILCVPDELEAARQIRFAPGWKVCVFHGVDSFAVTQKVRQIIAQRAEEAAR